MRASPQIVAGRMSRRCAHESGTPILPRRNSASSPIPAGLEIGETSLPVINERPGLVGQDIKRGCAIVMGMWFGQGNTALVSSGVAELGVPGKRSVDTGRVELDGHIPASVLEALRWRLSLHGLKTLPRRFTLFSVRRLYYFIDADCGHFFKKRCQIDAVLRGVSFCMEVLTGTCSDSATRRGKTFKCAWLGAMQRRSGQVGCISTRMSDRAIERRSRLRASMYTSKHR